MTLERFLEELECHCQSTAIATFMSNKGESFVVDLQRKGKTVVYGYHKSVKKLFTEKIRSGCDPSASLILRSFTLEIDELTKLPYKELRGYLLTQQGNELEFQKISPEQMFACQNTDAKTGEPLPLEQSIRYC